MNKKRWTGRLMLVGGVLELFVALFHLAWPLQLKSSEINLMPGNYRSLFMLAIIAVGVCLATFGLLSIYFSGRIAARDQAARVYAFSQGLLWIVRGILEIIFPVRVPLFIIAVPHYLVLPFCFIMGVVFLLPLFVLKSTIIVDKK
jgi:hypothetical protein